MHSTNAQNIFTVSVSHSNKFLPRLQPITVNTHNRESHYREFPWQPNPMTANSHDCEFPWARISQKRFFSNNISVLDAFSPSDISTGKHLALYNANFYVSEMTRISVKDISYYKSNYVVSTCVVLWHNVDSFCSVHTSQIKARWAVWVDAQITTKYGKFYKVKYRQRPINFCKLSISMH